MKQNLVLLFALLLVIFVPVKSFSQNTEDDNRIANQFIVMLKPAHKIEGLLQDKTFVGRLTNKECLSPRMNIYLLECNAGSSREEFLLSLQRNENVKLAQFNHRNIKPRSLIPNDPDFAQQWNMLNTGQQGGIAGADIDATEAWAINHSNVTACGDTIVVAIIDGKFDLNHEDLNYFTNYNEIPGNGIDDDGNGYIDDVNGWNVFDNNGDVNSTSLLYAKHSTHCAGIAAAIGNNGKGVAGVCWGAKILPVYGSSNTESDVVKAYDYVRTMRLIYNNTFGTKGAYIVATNSSFGVDNGNPVNYPIWCAMYDSMGYVGILSAAATANAPTNVDTDNDMPTECASNWLITVTNTWPTDAKESSAGYGKTTIDLGAPGHNIRSTVPPSNYDIMSGTSMSSPHVAGTIAAIYAAACKSLCNKYYEQPDSISLLIKQYILDAAEWNSSLNNITVTNGRLNLYRAITNLRKFNCDSCNYTIAVAKTDITCKQANDGQAIINLSNDSSNYSIAWSNGDSVFSMQNLSPGFYSATVTDTATGCSRFVTAEFHNPDSIVITSISINPSVGGDPGNIVVHASAGNEKPLYSLDGINYQLTSTFSVPANGNYTVYIKNGSGCVLQQSVVVSDVEELRIANYELRIFPNPASDEFTVYCPQFENKKTLLGIFDVTGRRIFETIPQATIFNLQSSIFSSGIYFIKIANATRKLVISK